MADNINQNVAILSLMASLKDNSKEVTRDVEKLVAKVEKNAGEITFKGNTDEVQAKLKAIVDLMEKELKGVNTAKYLQPILEVFSDSTKSAEQYLEAVNKVTSSMKDLARIGSGVKGKNDIKNFLPSLNQRELSKALTLQDEIEKKRTNSQNRISQAIKKTENIEVTSMKKLKSLYKENEKYVSSISDDRVANLMSQMGIKSSTNETKNEVKQYSELLSLFEILQNEKKDLGNIDTADDALKNIEITKTLLSLYEQIETKRKMFASNSKYKATDTSVGLPENYVPINEYSILQASNQYVGVIENETKKAVLKAEEELSKYVIQRAQAHKAKSDKEFESSVQKVEKRYSDGSSGDTGNIEGDIAGIGQIAKETSDKVDDLGESLNNLGGNQGGSDNELDLWAKSAENLKEEFADVIKYAVDAETAFNRLNEIWKKYDKGLSVTQDETTEMWGLMKRLDELDLNGLSNNFQLSEDQIDEFREWEDDDSYSKLFNKIQDMTEKQLVEIERLKVAQKELAEQSIPDSSSTSVVEKQTEKATEAVEELVQAEKEVGKQSENFTKSSQEILELVQRVETLEASLSDMQGQLNSLNGEAFEKMQNDIVSIQQELSNAIEKIKELKAQSSLESNLGQEGLTTETAQQMYDVLQTRANLIDTVTEYHDKVKDTNAYLQKGNDLIEERAILLKNGKQVGEEYVMSDATGKVNIGNGIKEYKADSVLHTHAFSEEVNNLRFSDADIQELVDGTVKKALLLCGNEIATLDMTGVKPENFESLQNDILDIYNGVFARFGAEIKDGKLINNLPPDIQNQATDIINSLMSKIVKSYGGNLIFDKIEDGDFTANDDARLPKIDSSEFELVQRYIDAVTSKEPAKNVIALQKQFGVLKSELQEVEQQAEKTTTVLSEGNQSSVLSSNNENVTRDLIEEQKALGELDMAFRGVEGSVQGFMSTSGRLATFFTNSPYLARQYADALGGVYQAQVALGNSLEIQGRGRDWNAIEYLGDGSDEASVKIIKLRQDIDSLYDKLSGLNVSGTGLGGAVEYSRGDYSYLIRCFEDMETEYDSYIDAVEKGNIIEKQADENAKQLMLQLYNLEKAYKAISDAKDNVYGTHTTDEFAELAKANGYDSVIFRDIKDSFDKLSRLTDVGVIFDERQVADVKLVNDQIDNLIQKLDRIKVSGLDLPMNIELPKGIEKLTDGSFANSLTGEVFADLKEALESLKEVSNQTEVLSNQTPLSLTDTNTDERATEIVAEVKQANEKIIASNEEVIASEKEKDKVISDDNIDSSSTTKISGDLDAEKSNLKELESAISSVIDEIDRKTQAFHNEKAAVDMIIPSEIATLESLAGELIAIRELIEQISKVPIDLSFDTTNLDENTQKVLKDITESLSNIDTSSLGNIGNVLEGFKISKTNVENLQKLANAILTLKSNLNNVSGQGQQFLSDIKELIAQADGLKDLATVLNASKNKISEAKKEMGSSSDNSSKEDDSAKVKETADAYDELTVSLKRYNELKEKEFKGNLKIPNESNELKELQSKINEASAGQGKYANATDEAAEAQDRFNKKLKEYQDSFNENVYKKLNSNLNVYDGKKDNKTVEYRSEIEKIRKEINNLDIPIKFTDDASIAQLKEAEENIKGMMEKLDGREFDLIPDDKINNLLNSAYKSLNKDTAAPEKLRSRLRNVIAELERLRNSGEEVNGITFDRLQNEFKELQLEIQKTGKTGASMGDKIKKKFGDVAAYFATYVSIQDAIQVVRQGYQYVAEIDKQMIELEKVSNMSDNRLAQSFEHSTEAAKDLGSTISDVVSATADWSRLGYEADAAEELAEVATLYKNVGDGIDIDTANESLISTLQGFQMEASEAIDIIDKFNEVSNNFPTSSAGIGAALQRSAASFNSANTELSESIALIVGSNSVLQDEEKVGNMWRTVSARIRGASTELIDLGEETDAYVESTSKLRDLVKGMTGFDIMADEDTFKDIYQIIVGIGEEWENLSDIDQAALLEALAGKQQSNALAAALNNVDMIKEAYETAENSSGSAMKEQEKWEEGLEAKTNKLKASLEELSTAILDSDLLGGLIDTGRGVIEVLTEIIDKLGLIPTLLTTIGGGLGIYKSIKGDGRLK